MGNSDRGVYQPPPEDIQVYDPAEDEEQERSRLPILIVIALLVLAAFGGVVWLAYNQGVARGRADTPRVIAAPAGPVRTEPAEANNAQPSPLRRPQDLQRARAARTGSGKHYGHVCDIDADAGRKRRRPRRPRRKRPCHPPRKRPRPRQHHRLRSGKYRQRNRPAKLPRLPRQRLPRPHRRLRPRLLPQAASCCRSALIRTRPPPIRPGTASWPSTPPRSRVMGRISKASTSAPRARGIVCAWGRSPIRPRPRPLAIS